MTHIQNFELPMFAPQRASREQQTMFLISFRSVGGFCPAAAADRVTGFASQSRAARVSNIGFK